MRTTRRGRALGVVVAVVAMAAGLLAAGAPPASAITPSPIFDNAGCTANTLPANDDGSTGSVALPFTVNYLGVAYNSLFVNNNGNVTFENPLSTFTPFALTSTTPPIIAPFFGDVDTRGSGSGLVTYGSVADSPSFFGHDVFCVNWLNVGFFSSRTDKTNSFQLLLVERNDRNPGDFDIVFNYDRVQWETGNASGGTNGLGGTSAGVGYSSGNGNALGFVEMPCSRVNGGCLDSNTSTGLTRTLTNATSYTPMVGRHVFPIESGGLLFTGEVTGRIVDQSNNPVSGAWVQVCPTDGSRCRSLLQTPGDGQFDVTQLPPGDLELRVSPPGNLRPATRSILALGDGEVRPIGDVTVFGPTPPPNNVEVNNAAPGAVPVVVVGRPFPVDFEPGCGSGAVHYVITASDGRTVEGDLVERSPGVFGGNVTVPFTGPATVELTRTGCVGDVQFDIYIDPSGNVLDTHGTPIAGATVELRFSASPNGPFLPLPDQDTRMSPANRDNPDLTDATGHFGWDVTAGFYVVRASAAGCTAPGNHDPFVDSAVLQIPPAVTDLQLVLDCGGSRGSAVLASCDDNPAPFNDVGVDNVHAADIACSNVLGLFTGLADGTFGGQGRLSRAQVASVLDRTFALVGHPLADGPDVFRDDDGSVHERSINRLAAAGLLTGGDDGAVHPSDPVSRAQLAALLVRAYEALGGTVGAAPDAFDDDNGTVLEDELNTAAALGILRGVGGRTAAPSSPVNRDQAASLFVNLLHRLVDDGFVTLDQA